MLISNRSLASFSSTGLSCYMLVLPARPNIHVTPTGFLSMGVDIDGNKVVGIEQLHGPRSPAIFIIIVGSGRSTNGRRE